MKEKKIVHPFRNFDRDRKKKFLPVDKFMENLEDEKVAITKLKLLRDFGTIPEEMKDVVDGASPRFGFVADYIGNRERNALSEISQDSNLGGELIMENGQVLLFTHDENGISKRALTQEQKEEITPMLLEDVKEYYKQYFETEAPQIYNLLETYAMIENMPPEVASKTATLKANLYTKIRLFANGDKFFGELGFLEENIESTCGKAKNYLENKKEIEGRPRSKHESDLDFLSAIVQNDVIDTIISGRDYTEEDLQKLMKDVRASCEDAEFSDDEFKSLLDEVMDKSMSSEEISRGTVNSEIGIEEANAVANEIRKMQTKDLLQDKEKE